MPFVRISLTRGRPAELKRAVSEAIHRALMDVFGIPESDRFQVIEEVDPDNLIFPPAYMGIHHSADLIYIQIFAKEGRTVAMKRDLYRRAVGLIATTTSQSTDDLVIMLTELKAENWSFGRGLAQLAPDS